MSDEPRRVLRDCTTCESTGGCYACAVHTCWCLIDAHGIDLDDWADDDPAWEVCHESLQTADACADGCCGECGGTGECADCCGAGVVDAYECAACCGTGTHATVFSAAEEAQARQECDDARRLAEEFARRRHAALAPVRSLSAEHEGYVYAITDGTDAVKLGWAQSVVARRNDLQTGNPRCLTVLASMPGVPEDERRLHVQLASYRINNEWFDLSATPVRLAVERMGHGVITDATASQLALNVAA